MLAKQKQTKKWINDEIKEEIKKYLEANNNKNTAIQILWHAAKAILEENSHRPSLRNKISKQPNPPPKRIRKRTNKNLHSAEGRR